MKTFIGKTAAVLALALMTTGAFAAEHKKDAKKDVSPNDVKTTLTLDKSTVDVELNIDNATEGESTVIITDADGNVVLTDTFEHDGDSTITKNYQLDQPPFGDYTIRVVTAEPTLQK